MLGPSLLPSEQRRLGCFIWDASASAASYVLQLPQCHWQEGEVEDGRRAGDSMMCVLLLQSDVCTGVETATADGWNGKPVS